MRTSEMWTGLMQSAQNGDAKAYTQLLQEVSVYLKAFLASKLRTSADQQDLLQDILLSIHKARHTFDPSYPFKPWLMAIAQSRLIDFWRKNSRRLESGDGVEDSQLNALVAEADISFIELNHLRDVMNKLPEQQRLIVVALKIEGKSIRMVSSELSMSESAVKVAAHRAYQALAIELGVPHV